MKSCLSWLLLASVCSLFSVGCGQSKAPVATSGDEVSRYLDEHPELKENRRILDYPIRRNDRK